MRHIETLFIQSCLTNAEIMPGVLYEITPLLRRCRHTISGRPRAGLANYNFCSFLSIASTLKVGVSDTNEVLIPCYILTNTPTCGLYLCEGRRCPVNTAWRWVSIAFISTWPFNMHGDGGSTQKICGTTDNLFIYFYLFISPNSRTIKIRH